MIKLIYSRNYFYAIVISIVLFLSCMSFGLNKFAIIVYFINFFLAASYISLFLFKKLKEELFYSIVIILALLATGLYIFFAFFEKYSAEYKIYLFPAFFVLNLWAALYYIFRRKLIGK